MDPTKVDKLANRLLDVSFEGALEALTGADHQRLSDPVFQAKMRAALRPIAQQIAEAIIAKVAEKKARKAQAAASSDPIVAHIVACLEGDPRAQEIRQKLHGLDDAKAMKIVVSDLLPIVVRCARSWEQAAA